MSIDHDPKDYVPPIHRSEMRYSEPESFKSNSSNSEPTPQIDPTVALFGCALFLGVILGVGFACWKGLSWVFGW